MEIRRLVESEAAAVWALRLEALEREPSSFAEAPEEMRQITVETYAERLRPSGNDDFILGAFDVSGLIGMTGFHREPRLKRRHKALVWGVYVAPEYRGQGVARALLTALVDIARGFPDLRWIYLSVTVEREPAQRLYRSLGFERWGIEPHALRVGDEYYDEAHMALDLSGPKP